MQIRRDFLRSLEAAIVGLFLVQSIRYLYATLFAHVSSADLVRRVNFDTIRGLPGVVDPDSVQREIIAVSATLLAPLLALLLARTRWSIPLAVAFCAIGRTYTLQLPESGVLAAAVVVASGLLYMTLMAIRRPRFFPVMLTAGFAGDQIIRAMNATADPTFDPDFRFILFGRYELQLNEAMVGIALGMLVLTAITTLVEREEARLPGYRRQPPGYLTGWGGLALGGILFLEFTLLGLPNAVARWAHLDYYLILPMILTATTLTLVPEVRSQAGRFLSIFDGSYRGWLWALLLALLLVIAKRFDGITAALALSIAQFLAILTLWWLVKQPEEGRRYINPTPILILLGAVVFVLLTVGDYFTYNYAYVEEIAAPFSIFEEVLRGMGDMGLALALFAAILACMPMILERQIIPWREGKILETILTLALVLIVTISATRAAVPAPLRLPFDPNCLRIASLNIESGYTPFFAPNLEEVAQLILESGADVVLLQEVEAGIMSSGSIDQALWLADRTNMNATFFPQIETLQGLAILSRLNVSNEAGYLLSSIGAQAGVQYVRYSLDQSGDLHIYNTWLNYPQATINNVPVPEELQDQAKQMDELYNLVLRNHFASPNSPDRVVLGGSFNVVESSAQYQRWAETVFEDPFTSLFAERRNTLYLINGESARWDYLWLLNLRNSGSNIIQEAAVSKRRMSVVAVGREANQACPAS